MGRIIFLQFLLFLWVSSSAKGASHPYGQLSRLQESLGEYVERSDARIGIALITDGGDTLAVSGGEPFPMLSVYKFPIALAVAEWCGDHHLTFADSVAVYASDLHPDTWSPLRDLYGIRDLRLPVSELLAFALQLSDNNACDILLRLIGGCQVVDTLMMNRGYHDIVIRFTEDEMHRDISRCYLNTSTPLSMARLMMDFARTMREQTPLYAGIASLMENCSTGTDRLSGFLKDEEVVIGHKTGTGDTDADGRIIAVNDCGYFLLPDGRCYSLAVFVADSPYDIATTSRIIAEISHEVYLRQSKSL